MKSLGGSAELLPLEFDNGEEKFSLDPNFVTMIAIYSSISTVVPKIAISITDKNDLRETKNLVGGIKTSLPIQDNFGVRKDLPLILNDVKEQGIDQLGTSMIVMNCFLDKNFNLIHDRVYKSWQNETPSNLAKGLIPNLITEPTLKVPQISSGGVTKNKFIRRISTFSKASNGNQGMLFFETLDDIFFLSIDSLFKTTKDIPLFQVNDNPSAKNTIIDLKEIKHYKTLATMNENLFKNESTYFDYQQKKFVTTKIEPKETMIAGSELFHENLSKETKTSRVHIGTKESIQDEVASNVLLNRYGKKYQMLVNGNFELHVGMVIEVFVPKKFSMGELSQEHNGKYLVTKIAHHYQSGSMKTKLELLRNSKY